MAMNADIFDEREQWRSPLLTSLVLHGALFVSLIGYAYVFGSGKGESWGNGGIGGDAMNATRPKRPKL